MEIAEESAFDIDLSQASEITFYPNQHGDPACPSGQQASLQVFA